MYMWVCTFDCVVMFVGNMIHRNNIILFIKLVPMISLELYFGLIAEQTYWSLKLVLNYILTFVLVLRLEGSATMMGIGHQLT